MTIHDGHDEIQSYLKTQNAHALIEWGKSQTPDRCAHKYPYLHRIADIVRGNLAVRVTRCATCAEKVFVAKIDLSIADASSPGVPYLAFNPTTRGSMIDAIAEPH